MAKRAPVDEKPYRPVEDSLVQSVLNPFPQGVETQTENTNGATPHQEPPTLPPVPLSPPEAERTPVQSALAPAVEKLSREKRVLISRSEERDVERLVADMADTLCTPLKLSHVLRATVLLLRQSRAEILAECRRVGPLKRPYNGEAEALTAFEHDLARIIDHSLRNRSPLD